MRATNWGPCSNSSSLSWPLSEFSSAVGMTRSGDPRFAVATHPSQAETATSAVESVGSAVLDDPALHLVPMGRGPGSSEPETVVGWHRADFRLFWKWQSRARLADRKLLPKFGPSSAAWPKRIRPGERPGSMENSRNWASSSPNEP